MTLPAEVEELLDALTPGVQEFLGDRLVGMYLFGSATSDSFDRESDVDVVVVTAGTIPDEVFVSLQEMHTRIAAIDSRYATQLEVSYIPRSAIRRYAPPDVLHPRLNRGSNEKLHMMSHDSDWVAQRYLIRERGVALLGPHPGTLIDPVSGDDLRKAMQGLLRTWLEPMLDDPPHVRTRGYQSFIVLAVCRILYTLENGDVLSKEAAATWGAATLDARWTPLIEGAWLGRQNHEPPPLPEDLSETWAFVRYAIDRGGR